MHRADLTVAGVGVLFVAAAGAGVMFGGAAPSSSTFVVVWQTVAENLEGTGEVSGDGAAELALALPYRNLTRVDLEVSILAAGPRAADDVVTVTARAPGNVTESEGARLAVGTQASATIGLNLTFARIPTSNAVDGESEAQARQSLERFASDAGRGDWTIEVEIRGGPIHLETHAIAVKAVAHRYHASIEPPAAR